MSGSTRARYSNALPHVLELVSPPALDDVLRHGLLPAWGNGGVSIHFATELAPRTTTPWDGFTWETP